MLGAYLSFPQLVAEARPEHTAFNFTTSANYIDHPVFLVLGAPEWILPLSPERGALNAAGMVTTSGWIRRTWSRHLSSLFLQMNKYLWLAATAILATISVISIECALKDPGWKVSFIILAAIASLALLYAYYNLFQIGDVGPNYGIAKGLSVVSVTVLALFLFSQKLYLTTYIGLGLIVVGVYVTNLGGQDP
jgi:uncharacterized membrane protein